MPELAVIRRPKYSSDYSSMNINGKLKPSYSLPGIHCDECGNTWANFFTLPTTCPDALRSLPEIKKPGVLKVPESKQLLDEVRKQLPTSIHANIQPGVRFPESTLSVPTKPEASFLWCAGLNAILVNGPVADGLKRIAGQDVNAFSPEIGRIGTRSAKLPPLIPPTGEPADMINDQLDDHRPHDYQLFVLPCIDNLHDEYEIICDHCGHREYKMDTPALSHRPEDALFWCRGIGIVISREVQDFLIAIRATNVDFDVVPY